MITERVRKITVLTPVDHRGVGILPCGEYPVSKQILTDGRMRFTGYTIHVDGALGGEYLMLAYQIDALVKEGKIQIEWGL